MCDQRDIDEYNEARKEAKRATDALITVLQKKLGTLSAQEYIDSLPEGTQRQLDLFQPEESNGSS